MAGQLDGRRAADLAGADHRSARRGADPLGAGWTHDAVRGRHRGVVVDRARAGGGRLDRRAGDHGAARPGPTAGDGAAPVLHPGPVVLDLDRRLRGDHRVAAGRPGLRSVDQRLRPAAAGEAAVRWACSGTFGDWHRRRLAAGLRARTAGQFGALLRLAAVEVLVMGATMGVATALSATAPPVGHAIGHESAHGVPRIEATGRTPGTGHLRRRTWRSSGGRTCWCCCSRRCAWPAISTGFDGCGRPAANWPVGRICWAVGRNRRHGPRPEQRQSPPTTASCGA